MVISAQFLEIYYYIITSVFFSLQNFGWTTMIKMYVFLEEVCKIAKSGTHINISICFGVGGKNWISYESRFSSCMRLAFDFFYSIEYIWLPSARRYYTTQSFYNLSMCSTIYVTEKSIFSQNNKNKLLRLNR